MSSGLASSIAFPPLDIPTLPPSPNDVGGSGSAGLTSEADAFANALESAGGLETDNGDQNPYDGSSLNSGTMEGGILDKLSSLSAEDDKMTDIMKPLQATGTSTVAADGTVDSSSEIGFSGQVGKSAAPTSLQDSLKDMMKVLSQSTRGTLTKQLQILAASNASTTISRLIQQQ
jgi:hypothetical protein